MNSGLPDLDELIAGDADVPLARGLDGLLGGEAHHDAPRVGETVFRAADNPLIPQAPVFQPQEGKCFIFQICRLSLQFTILRSEEHTSELQSLMRISYAVFCLTKKKLITNTQPTIYTIIILRLIITTK